MSDAGLLLLQRRAYILALGIMIATSSAKRSARAMPGELSMTK
jgi:hypothetical protein